ncbi:BREX-1 system adenine-specific DNA-methyltransferase PglX [Campylobacter sp. JMF_02 ED1]|uniref:Eco57I restriction-modification methylase domain-containing protein n=1 Tax=unclassified Campylobacter TaxID=2593542 RepID=UPI0022E9BA63|nr:MULTISPECIES: TaqI-like C-terminal specificity domain-containing protein [unclassified Campylobacter]MDA3049198.1 BREX-1 system adenine-specific DNA-methyltransferase PglX [Campylobacter sp. JMF_15 NE4]MDA3051377.1 BREX-1 system adenine-specific DNA-methyltransferase PglX [Campylobacter sp. JMF_02 ED1]
MALFKEKIIKEQKQDEKTLNERYENFLKFQAKIDAIKGYKEEEYQTDFLHDIFEACLGYTLKTTNPQNFNLARESKNETDAKKADGAILGANGEVIGVIELKDQKTHDLDKIENQAFNYHNSNSKSRYIIISNFDEIRLYIDKKTAYEKFSLFTMKKDEFELFHQIFCFENINSFKTIDLRDKSENSDREISKRLYADFSEFRLKLFENAVSNNQNLDKKQILSLVQKLCDRIIFVLFAEDYGLLRSNFIADIHEQWQNQKFTDFSLYEIWQKYFEAIDKGNEKLGVLAYNGGLFATDEALNSLNLSDEILSTYITKLSSYDFASDIGVNILGHIFEQSLSDLEELNSQIIGEKLEKTNSKRKKDGIFYTPEYITKFIVEQTLGEICENEKSRLNLHEIAIPKNPKRLSKDEKQTLENIRAYKDFLLGLKIIDPACGSGAFLNGALDFLINEHKNLDKFRKIYENEALPLYDIEPQILENNLFGVDINADAVQIAKLSLWLRTAQKGRKLTDLSNNIKCANSLLDFPFNFKFDCVIGNPPYVRQELMQSYADTLKNYKVFSGKGDLYTYFYELAGNILSENGLIGFISSGKFFEASYGKPLINYLINNFKFHRILNFDDLEIFEGISAYPLIFIGSKEFNENYAFNYCYVPHCKFKKVSDIIFDLPYVQINIKDFKNNKFKFFDDKTSKIFNKINQKCIYLKDINCLPLVGVKTGFNDGFLTNQQCSDIIKPYIFGKDIKKYCFINSKNNIVFPYEKTKNEYVLRDEIFKEIELLLPNKSNLEKRAIIKDGLKTGIKKWYEYQQINKKINFDDEFIVYPNVSLGSNFTLSKGNVIDMTCFIIPSNNKNLLAILNSKLVAFIMKNIAISRRGGYQEFKVQYLEQIPLPNNLDDDNIDFLVEKILELNKNLQSVKTEFLRELNLEKIPQKLAEFENLEFDEFIKEYAKAKKEKFADKLAEVKFKNYWQGFFSEYKSQVLSLKSQILRSENELNSLVFALYDLSADEIALIENA